MKRRYLLFFSALLMLAVLPKANAQLKGFSIGPYVEGALPVGDAGDNYKSGIGGGLGVDIKLPLTNLGVTASGGYMHFNGKVIQATPGVNTVVPDVNAFPIRAGLKMRFSLVYVKLEAGVANYTKNGGSAFIISPGIGVRVLGLDVQAKYENWSKDNTNLGFAGLKVGLNL